MSFFSALLMRSLTSPLPVVLFIHMPNQVEVHLVTERKRVQKLRDIFNTFAYCLAKIVEFGFIGLSLYLKNLQLVQKQFQITVNYSAHGSAADIYLL